MVPLKDFSKHLFPSRIFLKKWFPAAFFSKNWFSCRKLRPGVSWRQSSRFPSQFPVFPKYSRERVFHFALLFWTLCRVILFKPAIFLRNFLFVQNIPANGLFQCVLHFTNTNIFLLSILYRIILITFPFNSSPDLVQLF